MHSCITGCGRPSHDEHMCGGCWGDIESALHAISWLDSELDTTIARQAQTSDNVGVTSRSAEAPMPINLDAVNVRHDLHHVLLAWTRTLWDTNGHGTLDTDTSLDALSRWLLRHPHWIRTHPEAVQLRDEILDAVRRAMRTIDRTPQRSYLGQCHCGQPLYGHPEQAIAHCRTCDTAWDMAECRAWLLQQMSDQQLTATEMSQALPSWLAKPITPAMIRSWAHRGRIEQRGHRQIGPTKTAPLYRVGDVLDVLATTGSS